ncbi:MAG: bacillithiol biosynthesis cysteine-adding enzyme BshC [candidate division Zixibacteria bacterium RBG_16_53_22]|nr:MAG: bacillithiol biosynthesis cysteine-adding enzyme BshC [candidate division Zixibacteria bacterium RBG_16_53_22]
MHEVEFDKITGTSKLFLDYINCRQPACRYFGYDFTEISAYRTVAEQVTRKKYDREKLASIITGAASRFYISENARKNIEKLKQPDSLCVFAGQQAGLLLGPMYTVLKALTAYKLAESLEKELGQPVVPCFWTASDDHDFDEIKTVSFLNRDGECKSASFIPESSHPGAPMADIALDGNIDLFLSQVDESLTQTEFTSDIKKLVRNSYRAGRSISEAFIDLFNRLLGGFGIVPVDPNFPGMKAMFKPMFRREIEDHTRIFELFKSRSREIVSDGYHRQVHKSADTLNLFYNDGQRRNIIFDGEGYRPDGAEPRLSQDELTGLLEREPDKFSANVTLRPIAQNFAFPTIAQIAGPSEAAYFAQIQPLFEFHEVPWPVVRPRIFASLLEPHIAKIMAKLGIEFAGLANDLEFEVGRVIGKNFPAEIQQQADALRTKMEEPLAKLAEEVKKTDLESYQAIDHTRRRIDHELNHLSKKLFMAHKKKHEDARKRIYKVAAFLLPGGKFQERVLSPVYFANKFGPDLLKGIEAKLQLDSRAHQLVEIA